MISKTGSNRSVRSSAIGATLATVVGALVLAASSTAVAQDYDVDTFQELAAAVDEADLAASRAYDDDEIEATTRAAVDARNAVLYGEKAIDRSPCGTGTSARMALEAARGNLSVGDSFVHESIIGSLFDGRVESVTKVGSRDAIVPSIGGWARVTGFNTIFIDDRDPFAHGFVVT